ncbi:GntR family transcriptional regulator [Streptosporangium sp. NPDC051022]|uniref:GntR family transcriptional regulator n=1 Tax=Streptosporangium sp. NPDC051022 TaxID=3155752 RepID=UPI00343E8DB5
MAAGGQAPYKVIARKLADAITSSEFAPGAQLPSEAELRERFGGVSRDTIRAAIGELARLGLTVTQPTVGTFVRVYDRQPVSLSLAAGGREVGARLDVRVSAPPPLVAPLLPSATSVWWRRAHGAAITDSYYPRDIVAQVPELGEPQELSEPDTILLERAGIVIAEQRVRVIARMPTLAEEDLLGTPPGTALEEVVVALVDGDGRTVAVRVSLYPGDRFYLELVL